MKGKKLLASALSAAMVLGTMAMPVFADDLTALPVADAMGIITINQNADIDLNGATVENKIIITDDAEYVNISNGTIKSKDVQKVISGMSQTMYNYVVMIDTEADVTFNNVTIEGENVKSASAVGGINIKNGGNITISNSTVKGGDAETTTEATMNYYPATALNVFGGSVESIKIEKSNITGGASKCEATLSGYTARCYIDGATGLQLNISTDLTIIKSEIKGGNSDWTNGGVALGLWDAKAANIKVEDSTIEGGNGGVKNTVSNHGNGGVAINLPGQCDTNIKINVTGSTLKSGTTGGNSQTTPGNAIEASITLDDFKISNSTIESDKGSGIYSSKDIDVQLEGVKITTPNGAVASGNGKTNIEATGDLKITGSMGTNANYSGNYNLQIRGNESESYVTPVAIVNGTAYDNIDDAMAALTSNSTLEIASGSYTGFDIADKENITIKGLGNAEITVNSLNTMSVFGFKDCKNVTVEGIKFVIGETVAPGSSVYGNWSSSVIGVDSNYHYSGNSGASGLTVENCQFVNKSDSIKYAIFYDHLVNVKNCTFENFTTAISVMGDSYSADKTEISGNTFTKVNEPVNAYWGQANTTTEDSTVTFSGNTIESAKDEDVAPIVTIWDLSGTNTFDGVSISGNTYNTATNVLTIDVADGKVTNSDTDANAAYANAYSSAETALNLASDGSSFYLGTAPSQLKKYTKTNANEYADENNNSFSTKAAKINETGTYYDTLEAALKAATADQTITLFADATVNSELANVNNRGIWWRTLSNDDNDHVTINLNDHKLYVPVTDVQYRSLTINNGTIEVTAQKAVSAIFHMFGSSDLELNGVTVNTDNLKGVCLIGTGVHDGVAPSVTLKNSTINVMPTVDTELTAVLYPNSESALLIEDSTINHGVDAEGNKSAGNMTGRTILSGKVTIKGESSINADTIGDGISVVNTGDELHIVENADGKAPTINIKVTDDDKARYGIKLEAEAPYDVCATADMKNTTVYRPVAETNVADTITVDFRPTADENEYEIVLKPTDNTKVINGFKSTALALNITGTYTITCDENVAKYVDEQGRIAFALDGVGESDRTGVEVVLGKIKFTNYGARKIGLGQDSVVHTLRYNTNDVADITNVTSTGVDTVANIPTHKLTINIDFANSVESQVAAYTDMTVKVTAPDIDGQGAYENIIKLGNEQGDDNIVNIVDNKVKIELNNRIYDTVPYTVEITGGGYRTASYTVTMDADKTLNFWNDAKRTAAKIESPDNEDEIAAKANFLAGEFVEDGVINIFDLSAVVSYFGKKGIETDRVSKYSKYDLNRDGKINAKDVAYVLASWGN